MKETLKLGMILLIITVVSAGVLAVSNNLTKDKIAELKIAGSVAALEEIFGEGYEFKAVDESEVEEIVEDKPISEIIEVYNGDVLEGHAIKTVTSGYGGDLVVITGMSKSAEEILGMRLVEQAETKGIGSKATEPEYYELFNSRTLDEEVTDIVSGATITSTGVLEGVNIARDFYNEKYLGKEIAESEPVEKIPASEQIFGNEYEFKPMDEAQLEELVDGKPITEIIEVYNGDVLEGYAIKTVTSGYGGELVVVTGISKSAEEISGMRLVEHEETPGLGANAAEADYYELFNGKSLDDEITDAISGATLTSEGLLEGVNMAREFYNEKLKD